MKMRQWDDDDSFSSQLVLNFIISCWFCFSVRTRQSVWGETGFIIPSVRMVKVMLKKVDWIYSMPFRNVPVGMPVRSIYPLLSIGARSGIFIDMKKVRKGDGLESKNCSSSFFLANSTYSYLDFLFQNLNLII